MGHLQFLQMARRSPEKSHPERGYTRTSARRELGPGSGPGLWGREPEARGSLPGFNISNTARAGLGLAVCTLDTSWRRGDIPRHGAAPCPTPPAGAGKLPTMPAPATHVGLLILGVELLFCQVCEADTDGGQGLGVISLHDVAQETHPKFLGGEGWG